MAITFVACCAFVLQQPKPNYRISKADLEGGFEAACFSSPNDEFLYNGAKAEAITLDIVFPISSADEKQVGMQSHKEQQKKLKFVNDARLQKLRALLAQIKPHIFRKEAKYQVFLIEDKAINAFTTIGGYIYVTTGIMNALQNDDELAIVLGHEIGHNEAAHTKRFLQRSAPAIIAGKQGGDAIQVCVNILSMTLIAFNQPQELEADRYGFYFAYKAGYNPLLGLEFWKRMAKKEQPNDIEKLFRSHPYSAQRYTCGKAFLKKHTN
jgi:predicted Zn-dependent protease